jgi:hypothetical protein
MPGGAISDGRRRLDDRHEDGLAGLLAEALIDHPDDATFLPSSSARIDRAAQPRRVLHAVAVGRRLGVLVHLLARCSLGLPFAPACGHYRRPAQRGPSLGGTVRRHGPCHRDHRSRGCARADPGYSWEDGERIVPAVDQVGLRTRATSTKARGVRLQSGTRRPLHPMSASTVPASAARPAAQPLLDGKRPRAQSLVVHIFVILPMLALVAAVPLAWGGAKAGSMSGSRSASTSCRGLA